MRFAWRSALGWSYRLPAIRSRGSARAMRQPPCTNSLSVDGSMYSSFVPVLIPALFGWSAVASKPLFLFVTTPLPNSNLIYLPSRTCGMGSRARLRTWSDRWSQGRTNALPTPRRSHLFQTQTAYPLPYRLRFIRRLRLTRSLGMAILHTVPAQFSSIRSTRMYSATHSGRAVTVISIFLIHSAPRFPLSHGAKALRQPAGSPHRYAQRKRVERPRPKIELEYGA